MSATILRLGQRVRHMDSGTEGTVVKLGDRTVTLRPLHDPSETRLVAPSDSLRPVHPKPGEYVRDVRSGSEGVLSELLANSSGNRGDMVALVRPLALRPAWRARFRDLIHAEAPTGCYDERLRVGQRVTFEPDCSLLGKRVRIRGHDFEGVVMSTGCVPNESPWVEVVRSGQNGPLPPLTGNGIRAVEEGYLDTVVAVRPSGEPPTGTLPVQRVITYEHAVEVVESAGYRRETGHGERVRPELAPNPPPDDPLVLLLAKIERSLLDRGRMGIVSEPGLLEASVALVTDPVAETLPSFTEDELARARIWARAIDTKRWRHG